MLYVFARFYPVERSGAVFARERLAVTFIQTSIEGDQLKAIALVGKPPAPGARGQRGNWKNSVKIFFNLKNDFKDSLTGTADVMMNDVKWLKFSYNLSKKELEVLNMWRMMAEMGSPNALMRSGTVSVDEQKVGAA